MIPALQVALEPATTQHAVLLANLLELYVHDLSAVFPHVVLGPDGRFGYPKLPLYWTDPNRFPFLIRCVGEVAGFAFVTSGSPVPEESTAFDVAEFFVLRRYRRVGVGRTAAHLLWAAMPGRWTVRVAGSNSGALAFWRAVVAEAAQAPVTPSTYVTDGAAWHVFAFEPRRTPNGR